jgi:hypothetical protein
MLRLLCTIGAAFVIGFLVGDVCGDKQGYDRGHAAGRELGKQEGAIEGYYHGKRSAGFITPQPQPVFTPVLPQRDRLLFKR